MTSAKENTKIQIIRLRPQGVQVPEVTYVKKDKRIVFQGAIHIGDRKFYEKVIDRIKGFPGEAHLEGIVETDSKYQNQKKLLNSIYTIMSAYGNISYQKDFINKNLINNKKVFNYDITDAEVGDKIFTPDSLEQIKKALESDKIKTVNNTLLGLGSSPLLNLAMMTVGSIKAPLDHKELIVDKRNIFAINKALETEKDVFLFWGTKHLEGMHEMLLDEGFSVEKTKWITAISLLRLKKNINHRKETILSNVRIIEQAIESINGTS